MLTANTSTQIRFDLLDFYRNLENSALAELFLCFFSCLLFSSLRVRVAGSEGLWVINTEETSQYLVHVASSALTLKACRLQCRFWRPMNL